MISLSSIYKFFNGRARYSHPLLAFMITALASLAGVGYEAMIGVSTAYAWQEGRQAILEKVNDRLVLWKNHIRQSAYPLLAAVATYWLLKLL